MAVGDDADYALSEPEQHTNATDSLWLDIELGQEVGSSHNRSRPCSRALRLTDSIMKRIVRRLLLVMGCHETTMTMHSLQIIDAHAARQGTALGPRIELISSVVRLTCRPDAYAFGVMSNPPGGRTP